MNKTEDITAMRRVSITELIRETGLSRATIDRALNKRSGVHPRTESAIHEAIAVLSKKKGDDNASEPSSIPVTSDIDAVLQLGKGLNTLLHAAQQAHDLPVELHDMYMKSEIEMLEKLQETCSDVSRPLIISARNTEQINLLLAEAREKGKRIISLVSDLRAESRDAFVGIDNRMAGQTAAWLIGCRLEKQPRSTVGVVLGDFAFNCHEDREIGFRSYLRNYLPGISLADVTLAQGEDAPEQTYIAVQALLSRHPDIAAIYNVGGGNTGLAKALEEAGRKKDVFTISHEVDHITTPLLRSDALSCVLAQNHVDMLARAVNLARSDDEQILKEQHVISFGIYSKFNIPRFD